MALEAGAEEQGLLKEKKGPIGHKQELDLPEDLIKNRILSSILPLEIRIPKTIVLNQGQFCSPRDLTMSEDIFDCYS